MRKLKIDLQYTLLLLIQKGEYGVYKIEYNLQYTLLLLIRNAEIKEWFEYGFTIHFATINTFRSTKFEKYLNQIYITLCYY